VIEERGQPFSFSTPIQQPPGLQPTELLGFLTLWFCLVHNKVSKGQSHSPPHGPGHMYLELPDIPLGHQMVLVLRRDAISQSL
jgi:hypothetical protein